MSPRPPKFRFYLDENFPAPAGKFLESKGHNVECVVDRKDLRSKSDLFHIRQAKKEERILAALDKDFRSDKSLSSAVARGNGVLLISSADPSSDCVIAVLKKVIKSGILKNIVGSVCLASADKIELI